MRNPPSSSSSTSPSKPTPCCSKVGIKRGPWTPEEDEVLASFVKKEGEGRWRTLPKRAGLMRCGKSCRLRWMNYLRPSVKRGQIAPDEEDLILRLHRLLGNRWSLIAGRIPGRTDNEIKNYWNTHLSKKLISQGIDPRTHKPLELIPNMPTSDHHDVAPASISPQNPSASESRVTNGDHYQVTVIDNPKDPKEVMTNLRDPCQNPRVDHEDGINQSWQNPAGSAMMAGSSSHHSKWQSHAQFYMDNNNEDIFSSFLDSLINEDGYTNQHQRATSFLPMTSSAMNNYNNQGAIWDAELRAAMGPLPVDILELKIRYNVYDSRTLYASNNLARPMQTKKPGGHIRHRNHSIVLCIPSCYFSLNSTVCWIVLSLEHHSNGRDFRGINLGYLFRNEDIRARA